MIELTKDDLLSIDKETFIYFSYKEIAEGIFKIDSIDNLNRISTTEQYFIMNNVHRSGKPICKFCTIGDDNFKYSIATNEQIIKFKI